LIALIIKVLLFFIQARKFVYTKGSMLSARANRLCLVQCRIRISAPRLECRPSIEGVNGMECTVRWHEGMSFVAETGSGHLVCMDGAPDAGGRNLAPRPMELLLAGTGGCTAFDIVLILKRGRHDVSGCEVKLQAERAEMDPKVFTRINMHFVVTGKNLKPEVVERAVNLSAEKYCSASIMLGKTAAISHTFELIEG
jgi:putative redox protein